MLRSSAGQRKSYFFFSLQKQQLSLKAFLVEFKWPQNIQFVSDSAVQKRKGTSNVMCVVVYLVRTISDIKLVSFFLSHSVSRSVIFDSLPPYGL